MADYKILLGVELDTSDIVSQINKAESQVDPIKIKIDAETKELTKSIQDALKTLSGGTKNALTLDTSKFEGSIADIKSAVVDLKKVLGTLDDSANMKSLLASVNQIANAIGKVTDESETLAKSLSILSKKDFGFNFNLKTGNANPIKAATDYGIEARRKAIPAMQEQVAFLQDIIGGTEKADKALERYLVKQNKGFGGVREKERLQREMLGGVDLDGKTVSISKQMGAYEQTISYLKKIAVESGHSLDGFDAHFSKAAENIVDDTVKIQTGVKQTEEALESAANEMKQMFGGGVGADQLSAQLEPIVGDLKQIREAVQSLSSGVSLEGLTASFDRLSGAIENLLTNAEKVKGVLNSGFDVNGVSGTSASTPSSTSAVSSAQQTGKKIGETVKQSVKQSLTLDDVIDEQVTNLMNQYGIKGKEAFEEIRQAVVEYRRELQLANNVDFTPNIDDPFGLDDYGTSADVRKVMDTITRYIGKVPNLDKSTNGENLQGLWDEITRLNSDAKKGGTKKIHLPDTIKQEYGKEFAPMRSQMGAAFTTGAGQDFESWCMEINAQLGNVIDLSRGAEAAFGDLWEKWQLRKDSDFVSGDDIFKKGGYDSGEMISSIDASVDAIAQAEQEFAQTSNQTSDAVSQNQSRIRQEYEETKRVRDEVNRQIEEYDQKFKDIEEKNGFVDFGEYQEDFAKWQELENYSDSLTTKMQSLEAQLQGSSISDSFKEVDITIGNATDEVDSLESALKNIGVNDGNIEEISSKMKEFGVTAKNVKATLGADGDISFKIKGIDDLGRTVTAINNIDVDGNLGDFSRNISQDIDNTAQSFKKLKSLAKEMGDLDIKIAGLEADGKIDEANSLRRVLDGLKSDYQELYLVTEKNLGTDQIRELDQIFANTSGEVREFKQELAETAKTQELTSGLERLKSIAQEINGLKIELFKAEDTGNIERITNRLNELENESSELRAELQQKFPTASFDQIDDIARKGDEAVTQLMNKVAEAKAKLAQGIKLDVELGNYDNEISGMYEKFNKLSGASKELRDSIQKVEDAYREMELALQGSGDEVADRERLIQAEKEYADALERTNNLIRIQSRADKSVNDRLKLDDDIKLFQSDIDNWLLKNSAATKQFGSTMLDLKAKAEGVDRVTLNGLIRQFKLADKEAEKLGLKGLSVVDKLKTKFKEYSTYFSTAELFMYAEQALRSMFEQVKLIDSAMTELKKVTDETDASYNQFLSNAASRSKEIGTTIDGLVSSTADFARLGYGFEDAQGLAEVANIYAVVGDEIEGVEGATESLISTMAAFKDSAKGMSNSDFAMSIIDKFNEIGNNFAISSGGIGEALERSASSLMAANATLDESVALITASNQVVQDPVAVGRLMPTLKVAVSVKIQRWTRPRKDFISILNIHQLGRVYVFLVCYERSGIMPAKGQLSGHWVNCEYCGKLVYKTKTNYNKHKHHYCSNECQLKKQHLLTYEDRSCEICGKLFHVSKKSTQRFCSIACQGKWQSTQTGVKNPRFTREKVNCDYCGKEYYIKKYRINSYEHKFCSNDCRQSWYSEIYSQNKEWKEESRKRAVRILENKQIDTNTKPQQIINDVLDSMSVNYINEQGFEYYTVDNYLNDYNLIIEVMGDFWHCHPLKYTKENMRDIHKKRIPRDKAKHTYLKNKYNIEILYLWEDDIYNNIDVCKSLINKYINNNGILENYHSFNYHLKDGKLILNENIILPYQDMVNA